MDNIRKNGLSLSITQQWLILFIGSKKQAVSFSDLKNFVGARNHFYENIAPLVRAQIILKTMRRDQKVFKCFYELSVDYGLDLFKLLSHFYSANENFINTDKNKKVSTWLKI